ncbi:MAG: Cys-tRNA(Pro) deacylase [Bacilli bacterium]|nr:Cys-tRNA(Pro) deacylase [Bacilli bacterium]
MEKTNVMRLLDAKKIEYKAYEYDKNETDGMNVAKLVGKDENQVFKTLVTRSNNNKYYVFCIPVNKSLDLKKAASSVKVKSIEMIKQKELLPLTGYIHGGCSPIGMKKTFETTIDASCMNFDTICVSAGKVGYQVEIKVEDLKTYTNANICELT